jgi:hypothetical protein
MNTNNISNHPASEAAIQARIYAAQQAACTLQRMQHICLIDGLPALIAQAYPQGYTVTICAPAPILAQNDQIVPMHKHSLPSAIELARWLQGRTITSYKHSKRESDSALLATLE